MEQIELTIKHSEQPCLVHPKYIIYMAAAYGKIESGTCIQTSTSIEGDLVVKEDYNTVKRMIEEKS